MARMQYQPAARRRGFKPQQLSTEGISRMREESNRLIRGMEEQRRAQKEQRDRELQAMREDAAYTRRVTQENQEIALGNLRIEQQRAKGAAEVAIRQSEIDAAATQNILKSIEGFSQTAAKIAKERTAKMVRDQTAVGLTADIQNISAEQVERYLQGQAAQSSGAVALDTEIGINGVLSNEDLYETTRGYVSNHGFKGIAARVNDNKVAVQTYNITLNKRLQDVETKYVTADGDQFTGAEANSNPYLMAELQRQTRADVSSYMGFTDPMYLSEAIKEIEAADAALQGKARSEGIKLNIAAVVQQAEDIAGSDTTEGYTLAFARVKRVKGAAAAHDFIQKQIKDPDTSLEAIGAIDLNGNGKGYAEEWPTRWAPAIQERNNAYVQRQNDEEALRKAQDREWLTENIDSIRAAYDADPVGTSALVLERYHAKGMTVPTILKDIEKVELQKQKDLIEDQIAERTQFQILDLSFVNSIEDPTLQKQARAAFEAQETARYGPEGLGIKEGFKSTARSLTKINPNEEKGSAQTFLVQARLESEYLKELKLTNDPLKAKENVERMVDAGRNGVKSSPFYIDPTLGDNNRPVFPNIESSDREVAEMNTYISKQIIKSGVDVVDKPFSLATSNQMDAAYTSSTVGTIMYPPGILQVAEKFGLKPTEIFNAQRQANNAATGDNKPLLTPSPITDLIDNVTPQLRKLFLSDEPAQIKRASATVTGRLPVRPSMGGSSFNPDSVPDGYGGVIQKAATENNIPPEILAGLIDAETSFLPKYMLNKEQSSAGAAGAGQFMPQTAAEFGVDVNDPVSSIDGAARYLKYLVDYFNGDMNLAIYAYNGGMGNIEEFGGPIPGNQENQEYLQKVLNNANKYR